MTKNIATLARTARPITKAEERKAAPVRNALNIHLTGRGKAAREMAFIQIAPCAYSESLSRMALIASLRTAFGATPSAEDVAVGKHEYVVGRAAARMPANEFPKGCTDLGDRLGHVRSLVENYMAPAKGDKDKLRAGKLGRRSIVQQKVIRAAEEAWSQVKAELGLGAAQTQDERNAKKKATRGTKARKGTTPTHSELVAAPKPLNANDACNHLVTQAASLLMFCNKNAGLVPAGFATVVAAFKKSIDKEAALRASTADA